MPWSSPNSLSRSSFSSLDAVARTVAPTRLASWMGGRPTPPGPGGVGARLPGGEPAELEQALIGGAEGDRNAGGGAEVHPLRQGPRLHRRHGDERGVGAERHHRHHCLTGGAGPPVPPPLTDDAGARVANDGRARGHLAAGAVEDVAALNADRLHLDEDAAGAALRGGHVLVAEDVRGAGLVVDRCLPDRPPV